jgi:hypothetical protein
MAVMALSWQLKRKDKLGIFEEAPNVDNHSRKKYPVDNNMAS